MTRKQRAQWFTVALLCEFYEWRSTLPARQRRRGTRYRGLITHHGGLDGGGGVGAMRQLLNSRTNRRRVDEHGGEKLVLDPRFRSLFTKDEQREAKICMG